jgi:hypothetical protein
MVDELSTNRDLTKELQEAEKMRAEEISAALQIEINNVRAVIAAHESRSLH